MKRFWAAFGMLALIAVFLALPRADAAPAACFLALNDRLLPPSEDTLPVVQDGMVYAPYTVFESREMGTLSAVWTENTLELRGRQKSLTFDLGSGASYDEQGTPCPAKAIPQETMVYVPAQYVCQFFSLEYTMFITEYGTVVRLKNADAAYSDPAFLEAISEQLRQYYETYTASPVLPTGWGTETLPVASELVDPTDPGESQMPSDDLETDAPTLSPEVSPEPSESAPVPSEEAPSPSVSPSVAPVTMQSLHLGIYITDETAAKACLDWCDEHTQSVCLFFSPELLTAQGDLIRRAVGSGYEVGFYLAAGEQPGDTLEQGNQTLSTVARTTTIFVAASHLEARQISALEESGYVLFQTDAMVRENGAAAVDQALHGEAETVQLLFQDTAAVNSVLTQPVWAQIADRLERFTGAN